jgi:hypothetical protein
VVPEPVPAAAAAARFLTQSTFGPTASEIHTLVSAGGPAFASLAAWIDAQAELPPTSHRAHFRSRSNQPMLGAAGPGGVRSPCAVGSRWARATLSEEDEGREVRLLVGAGGALSLKLLAPTFLGVEPASAAGVVVTTLSNGTAAHRGWGSALDASRTYFVCDVESRWRSGGQARIAGRVTLSAYGYNGCFSTSQRFDPEGGNPPVDFATPPAGAFHYYDYTPVLRYYYSYSFYYTTIPLYHSVGRSDPRRFAD